MFRKFLFLSFLPSLGTGETGAKSETDKTSFGATVKSGLLNWLPVVGLNWFTPVVKIVSGESPKEQFKELAHSIGLPLIAVLVFLALWAGVATQVKTSLGQLPGPVQVFEQMSQLYKEHREEKEKEASFYERQDKRIARKLAEDPNATVKYRTYTGAPTFIDQIGTSLLTVFTGFILGAFIAIPIGIACGLSDKLYAALSPLIQIFKPVSPLAWLPIVTMVVSAVYVSDDPYFEKSFITSAITVMLCSLWPSLINTAVGVASIDKDLINVGRVLRLNWWTTVYKIAIPSALPMIFTGLRISLGIGWMVLIAAEMLAQNPGLGKFVWDEFQNGSSNSLGRIMVAVLAIGFIGFLLDWIMQALQKTFSHDKSQVLR